MPCSGPNKASADSQGSQIFNQLMTIFEEHGIVLDENKQNRIMLKEIKTKIQEIILYQRCLDF